MEKLSKEEKKKYDWYKKGLKEASTVGSPSCVGCKDRKNAKILGGYNNHIY